MYHVVAALPDRIQSIQDGSFTATKKKRTWGASASCIGGVIKFDCLVPKPKKEITRSSCYSVIFFKHNI
jgi:hypothetical protein